FNRPDFTRREITDFVRSFAEREGMKVGDSSIMRDVDCLIRTYVASSGSKKQAVVEETYSCPLLQLNLIQFAPDGDLYRFAIGPKPSLPAAVFAFALHEHFEKTRAGRNTMSLQECLYGEGSPGQVFKLDENSLIEYLEELEDSLEDSIALDETAGLKQIYRRRSIDPLRVLGDYYLGGSRK
ncbi:MAG TPA: DUF4007 family protein, partial [bacterium]|nr:DUF4007 family protein [bacterium]